MKNKFLIGVLAFAFVFTMFGVSYAATEWTDDNTFTGIVNWFPNGVKIGQQGSGGVTFFNGTIVNETTTDEGGDIPVTFGDNVRIDGELWRGENSGPGDNMPVKVNDDMNVYGDIAVSGTVDGVDVSAIPDTYVSQGSPSWDSRSGYLSITPGACLPEDGADNYEFPMGASGSYLEADVDGTSFYCSMQLPNGATVSSIKAYVKDSGAGFMTATLYQSQLTGYTSTNLGTRSTVAGPSGNQIINVDSINETVDNSSNGYFLEVYFSNLGSDYNFRGAIVNYAYTAPY